MICTLLDRLLRSLATRLNELTHCSCRLIAAALIMCHMQMANAVSNNPIPVGGYLWVSTTYTLYKDAALLGNEYCASIAAKNGWLDHLSYFPDAGDGYPPSVAIYCRLPSPPGYAPNILQYNFGWGLACPGPKESEPTLKHGFTCPINVAPTKPPGTCSDCGNPINLATSSKHQEERDSFSKNGLDFTRNYNSLFSGWTPESMPQGWRHTYSKRLSSGLLPLQIFRYPDKYEWVSGLGLQPNFFQSQGSTADISRPDGYSLHFVSSDSGDTWQGDSDMNFLLTAVKDKNGNISRWALSTPNDSIESYDGEGRLVSVAFLSGNSQTMTYSDASTPAEIAPKPNLLITVSDSFSRSLHLKYDAIGRLVMLVDSSDQQYIYKYDAANNLVSVRYPDGFSRTYIYNELAYQPTSNILYSHLLTGIFDEITAGNFTRYATFSYDGTARALTTEHAGGVDKYSLNYATSKITDPLGMVANVGYANTNGVKQIVSKSVSNGSGTTLTSTRQYDDNDNITSRHDFNGAITSYSYDLKRNLEIGRTEGVGTPQARIISTAWHPTYRLPIKIAEPQRITTLTYDDRGNLTAKTLQATSDATGALAFSAVAVGAPHSWTYTYSAIGFVLTAKGPRTDADDTTAYTYDTFGNLTTVTNAIGQVTAYSGYDGNGRPGRIAEANGTITDMTYSPRGWVTSRAVTGQGYRAVTSYEYDGVGDLTKLTLPDNTVLVYTYDAAHRLINIGDGAGNSMHYTLDNAGNRIKEEVTGNGGNLTRQTSRAYDTLGRLTQMTGAVQ